MKLLASVLALTLASAPASALAATPWQVNVPAHLQLVKALRSRGVAVSWGSRYCDGKNSGTYNSTTRTIKICSRGNQWTVDDLDTLRHEAIHVLQDLRDCKLGNLALHRLTDDGQLERILNSTNLNTQAIINAYAVRGASRHVILLELEAWGGASTTTASDIAEILENVSCK